MPVHVTLVQSHPLTPTYLVTAGAAFAHTLINPLSAPACHTALGQNPLDLILLTESTPALLHAAQTLSLHTGAPVLAPAEAIGHGLPVTRTLTHGSRVSLGGVQGLVYQEAPTLALHLPTAHMAFVGSLFTRTAPSLLFPTGTTLLGGHAPHGSTYAPHTSLTAQDILAA